MTWYWWTGVIVVLVIIAVFISYKLLIRITAWGGDRADALEVAGRFQTEAEAFRGNYNPGAPKLDGKTRIAPPTQDGGG